MGIFSKKQQNNNQVIDQSSALSKMVLDAINEGVIIVDQMGLVKMINPTAAAQVGYQTPAAGIGVNINIILKFVSGEGLDIPDESNVVAAALKKGENLTTRDYVLVNFLKQKKPVAVTVIPIATGDRIVLLRDITKELEKEGEQTEFISTASHEMRTPVASIEGYLGLALNPSTATIDDRARKYLEEAHESSKHLGKLFQDLLDVTKLDDKKEKVHMVPVEITSLVKEVCEGSVPAMGEKKLTFTFGSESAGDGKLNVETKAYASVDVDFLREIMGNYLENAIKYTKEGGAIWVNVRGDGDKVLVNVTDTGIGISPDDLKHVFQKFYRVDNSDTREIGGTGLGLYIVKKRAEAMGGSVWAESSFGEGSTFYLSLPRLTLEEYERRKQIAKNNEMMAPKKEEPAEPQVELKPLLGPDGQPIMGPDGQPVPFDPRFNASFQPNFVPGMNGQMNPGAPMGIGAPMDPNMQVPYGPYGAYAQGQQNFQQPPVNNNGA